jgi:hypothetical protein
MDFSKYFIAGWEYIKGQAPQSRLVWIFDFYCSLLKYLNSCNQKAGKDRGF